MADFIRARSDEQKAQRFAEITAATERLFATRPYHEITLSLLAEELGWSRANLYKYACTKEEIFLAIIGEKRDAYHDALLAAFPSDCGLGPETIAEVWAGIANAHRGFFRYADLLFTVVETNVSVERLMAFKSAHYAKAEVMRAQFAPTFGVPEERIDHLLAAVMNQAVGLCSSCVENPLVREALSRLGREPRRVDFRAEMREFISVALEWHRRR